MQILFVSRAYSTRAGGMERLSWEFIQAIKKDSQIQATVIAHKGSRKTSPLFAILAIPRVLQASRRADIVHLGDPVLAIMAPFIKYFLRKPICMTIHGLDITYSATLYQWYLQLCLRSITHALPISRHTANLFKERFPHIPFTVITPGIKDAHQGAKMDKQLLTEITGQADSTVSTLITVGRLVPRKGHAWFIRSVLPHLPENVHYIIVGEGPEKEKIENIVHKHHLNSRVHLTGRLPDEKLGVLYKTATAFIQPNVPTPFDSEGFGLVLAEAALSELPVFAADIEGIKDAIKDGENGTLLPTDSPHQWIEALKKFLASPHRSPSARAYTLENFNWERKKNEFLAVAEKLTNVTTEQR